MPLMIPTEKQTKDEFIEAFMSDEKMIAEFPDEAQRRAVAETQWEGTDRYNASKLFMLSGVKIKPTEKEQWIRVFPNGTYYISKYGKDVVFDKTFFADIANAFDSEGLSRPKIDKDHEFKTSYGDILGYNIKDDGMYFHIALNAKGVELVKNKEYSYISPAWGKTTATDKREYLNRLLAVSLVNFPALEGALPQLQEQLALSRFDVVEPKIQKEVKRMDLNKLSTELGLNADANEESFVESVKALKAGLIAKETELKAAADTAIALGQEIKTMKEEVLKKEATEKVKEWIVLGKIHPAVQEIVINRYILNKEETDKELSLIPEQTYAGKQSVSHSEVGIDAEIEKLMLAAKLDPKNKEDVEIFTATRKKG